MRIKRVNELYKSTYYRAGSKLSTKQPERGKRLINYGFEKGTFKHKGLEGLSMDIYVKTSMNLNGDDISPNKIYKGFKFPDYITEIDGDLMLLDLESNFMYNNYGKNNDIYIIVSITLKEEGPEIILHSNNNKFVNRKSVNNFLKGIKYLYNYGKAEIDKKKAIQKINKGKVSDKKIEPEGKNVYTFFRDNNYDWEKFITTPRLINSLWDYPPSDVEVVG